MMFELEIFAAVYLLVGVLITVLVILTRKPQRYYCPQCQTYHEMLPDVAWRRIPLVLLTWPIHVAIVLLRLE